MDEATEAGSEQVWGGGMAMEREPEWAPVKEMAWARKRVAV